MNRRLMKIASVSTALAVMLSGLLLSSAHAGAPKKNKHGPVYQTLEDARKAGPDVDIQGEFEATIAAAGKLGVQVIALGGGNFQAVVYQGGLPGAGWDAKGKIILDGKLDGGKVDFAAPANPARKKYLGTSPAEFSAVLQPAKAIKKYTLTLKDNALTGKTDTGKAIAGKKIIRQSPTMGLAPPAGAVVLFDATDTDAWAGGRLDTDRKVLCTDGRDIRTKKKLTNYTMHIEFMLPFRPFARGQGRGNSGFYQVEHYEVQILDSFGLAGLHNECGGVYKKARPTLNMCMPPLAWQTYDITFTNATLDANGKKTGPAVITLKLNGVTIIDNKKIDGPTGGHRKEKEGTPGPIKLQGHGNPLVFRNIWVLEK